MVGVRSLFGGGQKLHNDLELDIRKLNSDGLEFNFGYMDLIPV
jgi:hypothetical protein